MNVIWNLCTLVFCHGFFTSLCLLFAFLLAAKEKIRMDKIYNATVESRTMGIVWRNWSEKEAFVDGRPPTLSLQLGEWAGRVGKGSLGTFESYKK